MNARPRVAREGRFPRTLLMLETASVADGLRRAADELDDLAEQAFLYELGTLRRKLRGIVIAAAAPVVELGENT